MSPSAPEPYHPEIDDPPKAFDVEQHQIDVFLAGGRRRALFEFLEKMENNAKRYVKTGDRRGGRMKIIIINESTRSSIMADTCTFGCLLASFFVNYNYLGNSTITTLLISFVAVIVAYGRGLSKIKRMTPEEALDYLKEGLENDSTALQKKTVWGDNVGGKK